MTIILSKGERTRQAILDAAYDLIIEQGYAATSMRQIAEKSGLALGGIYNHFASKEDVFAAIVQERHPLFQVIPLLHEVEGETFEEFLRNAAGRLIEELGRHPDFLNLMLTEIVEFRGKHVPALMQERLPTLIIPLANRVSALKGAMRPIPPLVLVRAFMGMFFSYYMTDILVGPVMPAEMRANALDHFVEIFLHGVLLENEEK